MAGNARNVREVSASRVKRVELGEDVSTTLNLISVLTADDEAYVSTDVAGARIVGVNVETGDEGDTVTVKAGEWILENDTVSAVTANDIGAKCYFKDARTVTMSTGSHSLIAGTVVDVNSYGVKVDVGVDTSVVASS